MRFETQKAAANAAGRNSVLTPGQKEYNQAVTGGFQGSPADYQASLASQRGEAEGQGKYLGGLPAAVCASGRRRAGQRTTTSTRC